MMPFACSGAAVIAEARASSVGVDPPTVVSLEGKLLGRHVRGGSPDFRECFVCDRPEADGLRSVGAVIAASRSMHTLDATGPPRPGLPSTRARVRHQADSRGTIVPGAPLVSCGCRTQASRGVSPRGARRRTAGLFAGTLFAAATRARTPDLDCAPSPPVTSLLLVCSASRARRERYQQCHRRRLRREKVATTRFSIPARVDQEKCSHPRPLLTAPIRDGSRRGASASRPMRSSRGSLGSGHHGLPRPRVANAKPCSGAG
jgi:hypothetical protein